MEPKIELAKPRDFGEVISDTFQFIRQNFKDLLKNYFIFCGFFMVAGAASTFLQQYRVMTLVRASTAGEPPTFNNFSTMWLSYAATVIIILLMYAAVTVTTLSYMALYKQKGNVAPTSEEIWGYFKYYYLRVLITNLLTSILLGLGFVLCLIPGIWLFPIVSIIFPIMIMENASLSFAFNRAFTLINNNWWITAGCIFVIWIVTYFMMMFVTLPAQAINLTTILLGTSKNMNLSMGGILLSVVLGQLAQVLMVIPLIGIALCYFNLSETKDGTSLLDKINQFGQHKPQTDLPAEEY